MVRLFLPEKLTEKTNKVKRFVASTAATFSLTSPPVSAKSFCVRRFIVKISYKEVLC